MWGFMSKKICFIGHRDTGYYSIRELLKETIENEIINGCKFFTMGTHGEFDKLALSVCRELRQKYKDIKIEVVITSLKAIEKQLLYNDNYGKEYYIPYSDVSTVMYNIEETYFKKQIVVSNHNMINSCDTLICYVNKNVGSSGAKSAMNYAIKRGLKIINIYPIKNIQ